MLSTPTGSTAYSLSAGGPVVFPTLETIVVTPVSAHTLAIRPVILPSSAEVTLHADDAPDELLVTVDGQVGTTFFAGETLSVRRAEGGVLIIRFPGTSFFTTLRQKLGWGGLADRDDRRTMLTELRIRNFAIIESLTLPLARGLQRAVGRDGRGEVDHRRRARRCCSASARAPTSFAPAPIARPSKACSTSRDRPEIRALLDERGIDVEEALVVLKREVARRARARVDQRHARSTRASWPTSGGCS